ncbi:hypothetical protein HNY73_007787 [Argiope bruennichi]|uniref:Uncharacterized protein n=1 Tax=Argiope bruennichi TaxID=94029 RepID=A0A8T0FM83_ARGBR|nr:hypothetical protein HNY73_007787 [Argiope bruennichi]
MENQKASSSMDTSNSSVTMSTVDPPIASAAEVSANVNSSALSDCGTLKIDPNASFNELEYKFIMDKVKNRLAYLHAIPNKTFDVISEIALLSSEALIISTNRVDHLTAQLNLKRANQRITTPAQAAIFQMTRRIT